ncbi:MAG: DUF1501 domain-containing protein [Verrucomicrobiota bacterium]|nr:DUF1501 domain-containing protein [Verrucomicrobiota bacterium]
MLAQDAISKDTGVSGLPDLPVRAKRVIFLCMAGGPSHLETFDYKPKLDELHGKPMPESFTKGQPIAQLQGQKLKVQGHMTKFRRHGKSGQLISDFLPWTAKMADDICILRSMLTEQINHDPAHTFMNTGTAISGRPSMGSWINYGLGSETDELPGFVVLSSVGGRNPQPIASRQWSSGFLPGRYQGVEFNSTGDPVNYLRNPKQVSRENQRSVVDAVKGLDRIRNESIKSDDINTRVSAYEMAFRMQTSIPELMDFSKEPKHIIDMYGAKPGDGSYATNCLLARRLAERGCRFIHLYHRGWDHHGGLENYMKICCGLTDKPTWALLTDLKQRGMLKDTLVIWGGEFGRTPMFQGKGGAGRDHHMKGFSMWMAGGGVRGGSSYGATDELGYNSVDNVVHVRDLHATMLHLLGINHSRFTVQYQGLDTRLTGVEKANVVKEIIS